LQHVGKIAVVGSGPVGVTLALKLAKSLPADSKISLIDSGDDIESSDFVSELERNSVNKRRFRDTSLENLKSINKKNVPSKFVGGYSNYWGATWQSPTRYDSQFVEAYSELKELLLEVKGNIENSQYSTVVKEGNSFCGCMRFLTERNCNTNHISMQNSSLLLSKLLTTSDHKRVSQSIYTAWNSRIAIEYLKRFSNFGLMLNLSVERFSETPDGVVLYTSDGPLDFDLVVFACGPLETSKIVLRSLPEIGQILLPDTQMSYSLLVRWPRKENKNEFGLSHVTSQTTLSGNKTVELHTQYYAHLYNNRDLILSRLPRLLKIPVTLLLKILDPLLVVAINYISSEVSGYLKIENDKYYKNSILLSRVSSNIHRKQFVRVYRVLSRGLRKVGLLTSPLMVFHQAPGKSFHYGASHPKITQSTGKVIGCKRTYISGALCLPAIYPGPITTSAMSHGVLVAKEIIKELQ
jgi:hypothetical protein